MISERLAAEIRRLAEVEGWPRNTIARHLRVHHSTVTRILERSGLTTPAPKARGSMLDPYVAFVRDVLERYPRLPASVVYEMVKKRGYPGGPDHFRHRVAELGLRPRRVPEAFFELRTLPGEQAQVDWAHFGKRRVEGGERRLYAFVMVLSYSRALFVRFFYDARLSSFLAAHVQAFECLGGSAKCLLYDNLRSAVIERQGTAIRFHPRLLELADHYGFEPRPVAPRRGNEKGRVERAIRYLRTSYYPLRSTWGIEALNRDVEPWCREQASRRHAIRLATLRRHQCSHARPPTPIHSLAYYRAVLERLSPHELEPGYVAYVQHAYQRLNLNSKTRPRSQNAALSDRR